MIDRAFRLPHSPARTRRVRFGAIELAVADLDAASLVETVRSLTRPAGTVSSRARAIARVARRFGDPADPLRAAAIDGVAATTGFSSVMVAETLPRVFAPLEEVKLRDMAAAPPGALVERVAIVAAGNVSGVAIAKTALALAAGVGCLVKPSAGEPVTSVAFAEGLIDEEPAFVSSHAVVWWPGGREDLERAAFAAVDALVAYGSDEAIESLSRRAPAVFVGHGHRLSVAVARGDPDPRLAAAIARDVALHDQLGCLSPQAVFVVGAQREALRGFVAAIAAELAALAERLPRGRTEEATHVAIRRFRDAYEWRALRGEDVECRHDPRGTEWTVAFDPEPVLRPNPLHRTIVVHAASDCATVEHALGAARGRIESIGAAPWPDVEIEALARRLDVPRIVPAGSMQEPGLDWRQGGRHPLAGIVREAESGAP